MLGGLATYVKDHWHGKHSLAKAFWINFVMLRLGIFLIQANLSYLAKIDYTAWAIAILIAAFLFHGVLFVWQIVGVLRSTEIYTRDTGSQSTAWGAQLSLVVGLFLTISYSIQAWQHTKIKPEEENFMVRMEREHASKYDLEIINGGETLTFTGTVELGITRNMRALLEANNTVQKVVLNSDGGNIFEARGLAKLFTDRRLNTHVSERCSSACTSAFIGGVKRTMDATARFGFHQYRMEAGQAVLSVVDPKKEQERDMQLFEQQGVSRTFLEKILSHKSNELWFPLPTELLDANFVHAINGE
ncbi:MAG: hypothetical protein WBC71_08155 [Salaquimonas sp.]